ncbi:MAG: malectin [Acidobacteriia bacterium]|nr:malectin [Terriglobia bacterium]
MTESEGIGLSESREQAVRAELDRLLESSAFRTSKRCKEFLEYIVEHTLTGQGGALKERSLGVELFHLPTDFDPGQHTIVRVTANEVRKKLAQHYLSENGASHPVRIEVPPGSYRAEFRWETLAAEPAPELTAGRPAADHLVAEPHAAELTTEVPVADPTVAEPRIPRRPSGFTPIVIACAMTVVLTAGAFLWWQGRAKPVSADARSVSVSVSGAVPSALINGEDLRMIVGSATPYVDRSGQTWGPDRFFSGGSVVVRSSQRIFRTLDPDIYRRVRQGDFRYDIPLKPGSYELHLHFAETGLADFISAESSGEGQRLFRVFANGKQILDLFDVVADADGINTSDERVFRNISPAEDGFLHLSFVSFRGTAILNGIEVLPVSPGKVRPVRIRSGWTSSWQDPAGQRWRADSYFLGGNALVRTTNPAEQNNAMTPDMALYASERWGHFSYAVPVAEGRYRLTMKFCEGHYGRHNTGIGGLGSRVFDVYCNGVTLLRGFDIFKEAGGEGRPLDRTFSDIRPNAQGKIVLTFVPTTGMAFLNGIEVVEDSK